MIGGTKRKISNEEKFEPRAWLDSGVTGVLSARKSFVAWLQFYFEVSAL
jgi:hypothetical protein